MSATATLQSGFNQATFDRFLKGRDEPKWLQDRRRQAFSIFQAMAWPTSRDEEWRRTDIRALKLDNFSPP
ncbi:Fe-S cluster assembly protein SufD, partial [Singulisphaera rosea]